MLISQKLESMSMNCKDARASVGAFMLEQRTELQNLSMQQVADATYTSRSTLVRIAQKLGYSGWNELVKKYVEECRYYESHFAHISPNHPFEKGDSLSVMADKVGHVMVESILDTLDMLDTGELGRAAALMARSERIAMLCISPNSILAELFQRKMMQIGVYIELIQQSEQFFHAQSLGERDCAIVISYSGNNANRAPMRYLPCLKEHKVPIIAITSAGDNLLRSQADYVLTMSSREKLYSKIATFATEDSIAFLLNILYSCYFALDYDKNLQYKVNASREIEQQRYTSVRDAMEEENFPLTK